MPSQIKLTPEQINAINGARRLLNDIVPDLSAAEECGVDCTQYRQWRQQIQDDLDKIVKHFGGQPQ